MIVPLTRNNRSFDRQDSLFKKRRIHHARELSVSVIICTKDRVKDCLKAVTSVCEQSIRPKEILVVDGGSTWKLKELVRNITSIYCVPCRYFKTKSQLTYQRNYAISHMTSDVGLFIDDDVILERDYIERILEVYTNVPDVCGVGGAVSNVDTSTWTRLFRKLFLLPHHYGNGRMQAAGFGTSIFRAQKPQKVDIFLGCNMSYTREVLRKFSFDEKMEGPSIGEDADFSYRVSKEYKLIHTPFARLLHMYSPIGRAGLDKRYELYIYWHYYFFRKNMAKTWYNMLAFIWSNIGIIFQGVRWSITTRKIAPLIGMMKGHTRIFREIAKKYSTE